jgi:hypothetical protein|nr:MAG TPA: hypothetical protein [Caudoviricetes sp.]
MSKQEFIETLESMPDDAVLFVDGGFYNLVEVSNVKYDPSQNIIVIE